MANAFQNEIAETAVLRLFLNDPTNQGYIMQLTSGDFYSPDNKKIFAAMQKMFLAKKEIDLVTLSAEMAELYGKEEKRLTDAAAQIITDFTVADAWAIKSHIETLKSCAMRREVYLIVNDAQKELTEDANDTGVVLENVRKKLRDIVVVKHRWQSMSDVLMDTYAALEKRQKGEELSMPSGIPGIDRATTGFHPGELTIIGARPAVGKSALGAQIALATARNGYKVGIVSREMTAVQYGTRIIAHGTEIDPLKLRKGNLDPDDWTQVAQAVSLFSAANVSFMFTTKYIEDLRMEVQQKVDAGELDMLMIDYVQLLQTKQRFDKDYLRIAYISKALKDMTTDFNIAIIGLAQVNRTSENAMPTLADLRGSGDLEQDADNVIFMHRPKDAADNYVRPEDKAYFGTLKAQGLQYIALKLAKQRQGETGTVITVFNPAHMRFTMLEPPVKAPANLPKEAESEDEDEG